MGHGWRLGYIFLNRKASPRYKNHYIESNMEEVWGIVKETKWVSKFAVSMSRKKLSQMILRIMREK